MSTVTTRLGMTKQAGGEQIDVDLLNTDLDLLDTNIGVLLVNAGVTPPNSSLYDGAVIKEKTTDIIWVAQKNGGGGFDKVYIQAGATTAWSLMTPGPNLTAANSPYPAYRARRANGMMQFGGSMFYTGTIAAGGSIVLGSHAIISAGTHASQIDSLGVVGLAYQNASTSQVVRISPRTNGTLALFTTAGFTNAIITLDGITMTDFNAGM